MTGTKHESTESSIREIADRLAAERGVEIVDVALRRAKRRWHLRIDVDRPGPSGVNLDDCQNVSRSLSEILDEQDVIDGSYVLEVSSPGIDRPIRSEDDYRRNRGRNVKLETVEPVDGCSRFVGTLSHKNDDAVTLVLEGGETVEIAIDNISKLRQEVSF